MHAVLRHWTRHPGLWLVPLAAFVASASTAAVTAIPVICPLRLATAVPCPTCGMTRAMVALGHGELMPSLGFHPLGLPLAAAALAWWLRAVIALGRGRSVAAIPGRWWLGGAALALGVWLVRLALWVAAGAPGEGFHAEPSPGGAAVAPIAPPPALRVGGSPGAVPSSPAPREAVAELVVEHDSSGPSQGALGGEPGPQSRGDLVERVDKRRAPRWLSVASDGRATLG